MLKDTANHTVNFQLILKASGDDAGDLTGTATMEVNVDKVGFVAGTGTLKFLSNGTHEYTPTQAETNGDYVSFRLRESTVITALVQTYPIVQNDYKADVSGLSTFDASTDEVTTDAASRTASQADVSNLDVAVSTRMATTHINATGGAVDTVTTNTYMRGTDNAATQASVDLVPKKDDADTYRTLRDGAGAVVQQIRERLHTSEQP
jgi:hypothetical protein